MEADRVAVLRPARQPIFRVMLQEARMILEAPLELEKGCLRESRFLRKSAPKDY